MKYILLLFVITKSIVAQQAPRINFTPNTKWMSEAQSLELEIVLQEPIIVPNENNARGAYLDLIFTSHDKRVTLSSYNVSWDASEWNTAKHVTVYTSKTRGDEKRDVVSVYVDSESELYKGFEPKLEINLKNTNVLMGWAIFLIVCSCIVFLWCVCTPKTGRSSRQFGIL